MCFESRPQSLRELAGDSGFVCDTEPALLFNPDCGLLRHHMGRVVVPS